MRPWRRQSEPNGNGTRNASRGAVLVTGASSGIGAAVAPELLQRGFAVFGTVRQAADAPALERQGITVVRLDVTDQPSIAAARSEVERALAGRPLVGLVNNAGVAGAGPLELIPLEEVRHVFEVNVIGVLAVTQAFLPLLKQSRGRIVNMSSLAGRGAGPFMGPYAASKFALEAMSDSLRRELLPFGVDVILIEPGSVQSKIWDKVEALDLSRYAGSPYAKVLERFRHGSLRAARQSPEAEVVALAVARVLTARRPPARLLVSSRPWLDRLVLQLPARWMDRLVKRTLWHRVGERGPGAGEV